MLLGGISLYSINSIVDTNERVDHTYAVLGEASAIVGSAVDMETGMRGFMLAGEDSFLDPYRAGEATIYSGIAALQATVSDNPPQVERLTEVDRILREWQAKVTEPAIALRNQVTAGTRPLGDIQALVSRKEGKQYFYAFRALMAQFSAEEAGLMEIRQANNAGTVSTTNTVITLGIIVAVVIGLALAWLIGAAIAGPIVKMTAAITKLAEGDINTQIPATDQGDEIGDMARSLEVIRDTGAEARRLRQMVDQMPINVMMCDPTDFIVGFANKTSIETLRGLEHLLPIKADDLVGTCLDVFHKNPEHQRRILSDPNNLPYSASIELGEHKLKLDVAPITAAGGEYLGPMLSWSVVTEQVNLANNVSEVVGLVASTATEMQSAAESMASTAEETSRQSQAAAAASEQASTNVQTVSAAAEEMSSSVNEIARQVAQSAQMAKDAVDEAEKTNASVQSLAEGSQKIGEVVELISDIASQTNLLALNATIDAARAGEAGKGFAVVASEVKSLATQTAKATEQIAEQIASIQTATDESVTAIEGIGKKIAEMDEVSTAIASAIEEQGAATGEISSNSQQAAAGTQEVSSNIAGVNQAASETGTAASQVLQSASELSGHAEKLRGEVGKFLETMNAA